MQKINITDRILLLFAIIIASYQVVTGINGFDSFATTCYTVGFGVLIVAGLLIFVLGFESMNNPHIAVVSSIIPLSLSTGLIANFFSSIKGYYLAFAATAFMGVLITRYFFHRKPALGMLIAAHAVSGLVIVILPLWVCLQGSVSWTFGMVSLGGAIISLYGLMLSFAKSDRPIVTHEKLVSMFPLIFLLTAGYFTIGFLAL